MENLKIESIACSGGNWTPHTKSGLLVGAEGLHLANFQVYEIPEKERIGNLIICAAAKKMLYSIEVVTKILRHYANDHRLVTEVPGNVSGNLYLSRFNYLIGQLQCRLPKQLKTDGRIEFDTVENLLSQFRISYDALSVEERQKFKHEMIELLSKED